MSTRTLHIALTIGAIALTCYSPVGAQSTNDRDDRLQSQQNDDSQADQRNSQSGHRNDQNEEEYQEEYQYEENDTTLQGSFDPRSGNIDRRNDRNQGWNQEQRARRTRYQDEASDDDPSEDDDDGGLGVTVTQGNQRGVRVRQVYRDSPADAAGVQVGDHILTIDGQPVNDPGQLVSLIRDTDPNSQIQLRVERNGRVRGLVTRLVSRGEALEGSTRATRQYRLADGRRGTRTLVHDDVMAHIARLEQNVERLTNEIASLRQMLQRESEAGQFNSRNPTSDTQRN